MYNFLLFLLLIKIFIQKYVLRFLANNEKMIKINTDNKYKNLQFLTRRHKINIGAMIYGFNKFDYVIAKLSSLLLNLLRKHLTKFISIERAFFDRFHATAFLVLHGNRLVIGIIYVCKRRILPESSIK